MCACFVCLFARLSNGNHWNFDFQFLYNAKITHGRDYVNPACVYCCGPPTYDDSKCFSMFDFSKSDLNKLNFKHWLWFWKILWIIGNMKGIIFLFISVRNIFTIYRYSWYRLIKSTWSESKVSERKHIKGRFLFPS